MPRRPASSPLEIGELSRVLLHHEAGNDRGRALLACSWLANSLGEFLRSRLIQDRHSLDLLFGNRGALADFQPRIHMAFAVGLITRELRDELEHIRAIRNEFAHLRDPVDFTERSVRDRCKNLQIALEFEKATGETFASARDRFIFTVGFLASLFLKMTEQRAVPLTTPTIGIRMGEKPFLSKEDLAKTAAIVREFFVKPG